MSPRRRSAWTTRRCSRSSGAEVGGGGPRGSGCLEGRGGVGKRAHGQSRPAGATSGAQQSRGATSRPRLSHLPQSGACQFARFRMRGERNISERPSSDRGRRAPIYVLCMHTISETMCMQGTSTLILAGPPPRGALRGSGDPTCDTLRASGPRPAGSGLGSHPAPGPASPRGSNLRIRVTALEPFRRSGPMSTLPAGAPSVAADAPRLLRPGASVPPLAPTRPSSGAASPDSPRTWQPEAHGRIRAGPRPGRSGTG
jgi:hypothetical protein